VRPISETKWLHVHTPAGDEMVFVARPEMKDRSKSAVVLIHDLFASPGVMADWFGRLEPEAEVVLAALPGHGKAANFKEGGWNALVTAYARSLETILPGRRVLVVGAGLGGALALALNAHGHACLAVEPLLSTSGLWPLDAAVGAAEGAGHGLSADFLFETIGWRDGAVVENRDYGGLLDRVREPALVLAGGIALGEPRPGPAPSLMDGAAHARLAAYPNIRVKVVEGCGHDVLAQAPDLCRDLILDELARA
jgi:pimeloyl-ACP methyl ester carboxylesterase